MIYEFKDQSVNVVELDFPEGEHDFECMAKVRYQFGEGLMGKYNDVRLLLNDYYFSANDLDDLIKFLRAAQAKLRETQE